MNAMHVHLLLNHIPILGVAFGLIVFVAALYLRSADARRVGLATFVVTGAIAGLAYFTGEEAEEAIRGLAGVTEATVLRHDDAAWYAMVAAIVLGVAALGGLLRHRGSAAAPRWFAAIVLTLAVATIALMVWTGWLGGQIRHPEVTAQVPVTEREEHQEELPSGASAERAAPTVR